MSEIAKDWQEACEEDPDIEKAAFLRRRLGAGIPGGLADWLLASEDLHGEVFTAGFDLFDSQKRRTLPSGESVPDRMQPHVRVRVQAEVVTDGVGTIAPFGASGAFADLVAEGGCPSHWPSTPGDRERVLEHFANAAKENL